MMKTTTLVVLMVCVALFFHCGNKNPVAPEISQSQLQKTAGPLQISRVQIAITQLELSSVNGNNYSQNDPLIVDLDLTGQPTLVGSFDIPAGTYQSLKIKIHRHGRSGDSGFKQHSVRIEGTVEGDDGLTPFTFQGKVTTVLKTDFPEPLTFLDSSEDLESRIVLLLDPSNWFVNESNLDGYHKKSNKKGKKRDEDNGDFLDPRDEGDQKKIEKNIEKSIRDNGIASAGQLFRGTAFTTTDDPIIAALAVHENETQLALVIDDTGSPAGAIFTTASGNTFTVFLGDDGLPAVALADNHILVLENYTENSVDIGVITPNGIIHVVRNIKVSADQLAFLRSIGSPQPDSQSAQLSKSGILGLEPWEEIKLASLAISVTACAATGLSIFVPVTLPAALAACLPAIVSAYTTLISELNPELENSSSGISLAASTIGCGVGTLLLDPRACVSFLIELTGEELRLAEIFRDQHQDEIAHVTTQLLAPAIFRTPENIIFSAVAGASDPLDQTLLISNAGSGILNWTIATDASWLNISPLSGSSMGESNNVTIGANIAALAAGIHNATVNIADPAASNSPQTVTVILSITELSASPVLDQSLTSPENINIDIHGSELSRFIAQTFTCGLSGTLFGVSINVRSTSTALLRVALRSATSDGFPTSTILTETVLDTSGTSLSEIITFPQTIHLVAGETYAIVVNYENAPPFGTGPIPGFWNGALFEPPTHPDHYPDGKAFHSDGVTWFIPSRELDLHFQTYMIPEP